MNERRQQTFIARRIDLNDFAVVISISIVSGFHIETETTLLGIFYVRLDYLLPYPTCTCALVEHIHHVLLGETARIQTKLIKFFLDTISRIQTVHLIRRHYTLLGFLTKAVIGSTLDFLCQL